jgi:hypothetical protein
MIIIMNFVVTVYLFFQQIRSEIKHQQQLSKQRCDSYRQHIQYEVGQLVLARPVVRNDKMQEVFE